MNILIKYFAHYREKTGKKEEYVEGDFKTVGELVAYLEENHKIGTESLMIAVNRRVVTEEKHLSQGDEVAIFPPVSGG